MKIKHFMNKVDVETILQQQRQPAQTLKTPLTKQPQQYKVVLNFFFPIWQYLLVTP